MRTLVIIMVFYVFTELVRCSINLKINHNTYKLTQIFQVIKKKKKKRVSLRCLLIEQKQLRAKVSLAAFLKTTLLSPFFL
jgi:hypothetical protein